MPRSAEIGRWALMDPWHAPGWYADPERPGYERRWDGNQWTADVRLAPPPPQKGSWNPPRAVKITIGSVLGALLLIGILGAAFDKPDTANVSANRSPSTTAARRPKTPASTLGAPA